ncbi:MAG TPA: MFS transporter [Elusimicrobia bacterium]|nr:MFS transporter [Elusimicrobiota bacterium]HBT60439.1 MFS transporter [Elusimicrobiota bacterium]
MAEAAAAGRNPWAIIPTLYFASGLPYILINTVSVILYKRMGIDNGRIAFWTSWLYLPWVIKMLWGPLVDMYSTKRNWILWSQVAMAAALAAAAMSLKQSGFFMMSLLFFTIGAFVSATQDIAIDGFYMLALSDKEQAFFAGIRATFYRFAMIFGSGLLVALAGRLETSTGNTPASWAAALALPAILFVLLAAYHKLILPQPSMDGQQGGRHVRSPAVFLEIMASYFRQERIGATLAFILLYRLAEAMLVKLAAPFLLDSRAAGGLGLTTAQVGVVYGTFGVASLVVGGILGGWLIARYGFKRCLWPMVLALHLPDVCFVYMAYAQPPASLACVLVSAEQFGYGIGFAAFTVYLLMRAGESAYKTSHYAISTGIMALGMMVPGFASGYIQQAVGYKAFFLIVCIATLPGFLVIPFIPKEQRRMESA